VLGTTLWLTIVLALLAATLLDAAGGFARASVHAAADHAVEAAMHDALAAYQNAVAAAVASASAPDAAAGYPAALAAIAAPFSGAVNGGAFGDAPAVAYAVTPTTVVAPACGDDAGDPAAPDVVAWLQCADGIAESRMSLHVVARVTDSSGAVVAQRDQYVTLRVFAQPPYTAVVGRKDGDAVALATDGGAAPPHEGDTGGDTVSGAEAAAASPWPAGGTLIHVRYECHDGAGSCANAAPPDPDAALRAGVRWRNGNQPAP
jgi:hypothetical protein